MRAYNIFALLDWYLRHPIPGFKVFLFDLINGWLFLRSPGFLLWDTIAWVGSFDGCSFMDVKFEIQLGWVVRWFVELGWVDEVYCLLRYTSVSFVLSVTALSTLHLHCSISVSRFGDRRACISRRENRHVHCWACWMSKGKKNDLMWRKHRTIFVVGSAWFYKIPVRYCSSNQTASLVATYYTRAAAAVVGRRAGLGCLVEKSTT